MQSRQSTTDPRRQVTRTENLLKFGHVLLRYASKQIDIQSHKQTRSSQYFAPLPEAT